MKNLVKKGLYHAVQNEILWSILNKTLIRAARYAKKERAISKNKPFLDKARAEAIMAISPNLVVKNGVFKGLKYPELRSVCSAICPKLLGSYESEIESVLERIVGNEYTEIVDIGCAEGYYAVGLAMRIGAAKVYAYDTDKQALRLCKDMAILNGVSARLLTGTFCDLSTLKNISFTSKALILSDCEGYEKNLFTRDAVELLAPHDLLIEIHDFIDIEISTQIREVFRETHEIEVYQSIDDIKKAQVYEYKELEKFSLSDRKAILAEGRPAIMEWFFMRSRRNRVNSKSTSNDCS